MAANQIIKTLVWGKLKVSSQTMAAPKASAVLRWGQLVVGVICMVMIETVEALANLDEILSTPGITGAYIGPTDLALALGLPPVMDNDEPKHIETVNRILAACQKHKVVPGIHTMSSKFTQRYIDQGFKMVMLVSDRGAMMSFVKAETSKLTGWKPREATKTVAGY